MSRAPAQEKTIAPRRTVKLVVSSEERGDIRGQLGGAHYSYRFVENAFVRAFAKYGYDVCNANMPEIFKDDMSSEALLGAKRTELVHIAFRSTENIRILPGARNISHFAWEFDVMKDHGLIQESVTANQVHMLSLVDEVWVQCAYSKRILVEHGLPNVHVVPAPLVALDAPTRLDRASAASLLDSLPAVPLVFTNGLSREDNVALAGAGLSSLGQALPIEPQTKIFLTICNPHDLRKNLLNLIEGFQIATRGLDHHLIVKLLVPNYGSFQTYAPYDSFGPRHHGPAVVCDPRVHLISDYLSDVQMTALYDLADFYLCASHCEGLNMPLVEAMARGTIAITTRNTAMEDYVSADNAIVISERSMTGLVTGMAADVSGRAYSVGSATRFSIARAIRQAVQLSPVRLEMLAENGRNAVRELYGEERVVARARERLHANAH